MKDYALDIELNGYIKNMPEDVYHNTEGFISKSSIYVLKQSSFKFAKGVKFTATKAMQMGTAIHCAILEPEKFEREYKLLPDCKDRRQKEYKEAVKEFGAERVLVGAEIDTVNNMKAAIMGNDAARELLSLSGNSEVSGFHIDPETGVKIRHRFDRLTDCGIGIDIKKTQSVHPDDLAKTISKYGYHTQEAVYSSGYRHITGKDLKAFYFIFVEEKYPNQVAVVYLDDVSKQVGYDEARELIDNYCYVINDPKAAENNQPAFMVSLPEWSLRDYENDLEDEGIY